MPSKPDLQKPDPRGDSSSAPEKTRRAASLPPLAWMALVVALLAVFATESFYVQALGLDLQTARLVVIAVRCAALWLSAFALGYVTIRLMLRSTRKNAGVYPSWLLAVLVTAIPLMLLAVLTFGYRTPQATLDLARYYASNAVAEKEIDASSVHEICRRGGTSNCKLRFRSTDGEDFVVKGELIDILRTLPDIRTVRVLPSSRLIIGVRTEDGWL
ncbi:hypothetical protein [Saccharibacillus alkalitolerans]|uniref:Uncharacterized protein n=1 Tax=Saccharibacillus alkalitolerans TaxID=2705290 RepID=A0ABX0F7X0_9BACL|nr:hypothetical protein [Saccharibacillus alkalitolerans]NGZ75678.1 hypothetical protein [Saccharibacillus alkalitolerans]